MTFQYLQMEFLYMIKINDNISIIEPYFDGGESYKEHHKYACIKAYDVSGSIKTSQIWDSAVVFIPSGESGVIGREINPADVHDYCEAVCKITCPKEVFIEFYINGERVSQAEGTGSIDVYTFPIAADKIKHISYCFKNTDNRDAEVNLYYFAVRKNERITPIYSGNWEGCFSKISFKPYTDEYVTDDLLEKLPELIKNEPYKSIYESERKIAIKALKTEPEKLIDRVIGEGYRKTEHFVRELGALAFIGIAEKNEKMISMACRYAMSLCACTYWCLDIMEEAPACTWHHRSFTEEDVCETLALFLSLCGNSLSWHGRNIIYQSIVMKGLPRIEADLMTMEYIYKMNQGLAFLSGYIKALICLEHRFPRYGARIEEAERILWEMLGNAINKDGSTDEGASYWQYTVWNALKSIVMLAKRHKLPISEYVDNVFGDVFGKTAEFGMFLTDAAGKMIPYNDSGNGCYIPYMCKCLYLITGDLRWAVEYYRSDIKELGIENIFLNEDIPNPEKLDNESGLKMFEDVGLVSLKKENLQLFCVSGKSNSTHCHADKGSFILYNGEKMIFTDGFSTGGYGSANNGMYHKSEYHNTATPILNGEALSQNVGDEYKAEYKCTYNDGVFKWESNQSGLWDKSLVKYNKREILFTQNNEFYITDYFEFNTPMQVCVNYIISDINSADISSDSGNCKKEIDDINGVSRVRLYTEKAEKINFTSKITLK